MLPMGATGALIDVLIEANRALGLEWRAETFGTMAREAPQVSPADVEEALTQALLPLGARRG
jgi:hypothetical protein